MKLTIELTLKSDVAQVDIDQFFAWAQRIDGGPEVSWTTALGDTSAILTSPAIHVDDQVKAFTAAAPAAAGDPTWNAPAPGGLTHAEAAATETEELGGEPDGSGAAEAPVPGAPVPKKRGRKSTATRAAEMAAAAAAQAGDAPQPPAAAFNGALPPGVASPAAAMPSPAAAMPPAAPPASSANGAMALEDFKREALELHQAASSKGLAAAYPLNRIRATTWLDGSPKSWHTLNVDAVPAGDRRRVLDECMTLLTRS